MKAAPIALTDQEVAAMSGTGRLAAGVRRRLAAQKVRRLTKETPPRKQAPPPLTRRELEALRAGRPTATLSKKVFGALKERGEGKAKAYPSKQAPAQPPPRYATRRRGATTG
jgi:hypothetical protein